jgi:hypothetical protein
MVSADRCPVLASDPVGVGRLARAQQPPASSSPPDASVPFGPTDRGRNTLAVSSRSAGYSRQCAREVDVDALAGLGIFFAGLGIFFAGCGVLWGITLWRERNPRP